MKGLAPLTRSLSFKLLLLTLLFVLLAEVLIFAPSIGRFRLVYFQERIDQSYLATLALEASPDRMVTEMLRETLLSTVGAYQISRMDHGEHGEDAELAALISVKPDQSYDIRDRSFMHLIMDAFAVLSGGDDRIIEVIGVPTADPDVTLKIMLDEKPLRASMIAYSLRIFWLSLFISAVAAVLVFLALSGLLVRPLQDIVRSMVAFRSAPESDAGAVHQSNRADEIGIVQRELAAMQSDVRQALQQKTRLALLGTAVAKINHDLRNMLSTAALLSERLADSQDAQVVKIAPRLVGSIDRAIELCAETLKFSHDGHLPVTREPFDLRQLLDEVGHELIAFAPAESHWHWQAQIGEQLMLNADREQLYRVIANIGRNAFEAGAGTVTLTLRDDSSERLLMLDITDDGPGLPPRAQENLFVPFAGSVRSGGTGLGLTIAREIVRAHGGELELVRTDSAGTSFRITLPNPRPVGSSRATATPANPA